MHGGYALPARSSLAQPLRARVGVAGHSRREDLRACLPVGDHSARQLEIFNTDKGFCAAVIFRKRWPACDHATPEHSFCAVARALAGRECDLSLKQKPLLRYPCEIEILRNYDQPEGMDHAEGFKLPFRFRSQHSTLALN